MDRIWSITAAKAREGWRMTWGWDRGRREWGAGQVYWTPGIEGRGTVMVNANR